MRFFEQYAHPVTSPLATFPYCGLTVFPHVLHLHFQGLFAPGYFASGIKPFFFMSPLASIGSTRTPAQYRQLPPPRTVLSLGETTFLHTKHLDFQGKSKPGYLTKGFRFAASSLLSASLPRHLRPAQYRQPFWPARMLSLLGVTCSPHFKHLHNHGVLAPGYFTKGCNETEIIFATASDSSTRTPAQYGQP